MLNVPKITNAELAGVMQLRNRIKGIPPEFNTDFYLVRWWRGYGGDIDTIECKMHEVFEHRRILGYDRLDTKLFDSKIEIARKTFPCFSMSTVHLDHYSGSFCIFLQRMAGVDLKEITKVIPLSYVIHSYFILFESYTRAILAREAVTGNAGGAVVVLDLTGLNVAELLNPLSASSKLARLALRVWSDYFSETLVKVYILNSPTIISVMWQLTKLIMDKKTLSKVTFIDNPSDILKYLSEKAVPECYGGARRDDSGFADPPETGCRKALRITPQHYYDVDELWRRHGFERMPSELKTVSMKGKHCFEVKRKCERDGQSLVWHFTVNGDIEYDVIRLNDNDDDDDDNDHSEVVVWPKITLTTLKTPEQGAVICKKGDYWIRFTNPSNSWLPLKLHYIVEMS